VDRFLDPLLGRFHKKAASPVAGESGILSLDLHNATIYITNFYLGKGLTTE
jgi:hypothetical protein